MKIRIKKTRHIKSEYHLFNPRNLVAIDTETTGLNHWGNDAAFAISMCDEDGNGWYCQWPVNPFTREVTVNQEDVGYIISVLKIKGISVIFHNSKFDCAMLKKCGIDVVKLVGILNIHDTVFCARVSFTLEMNYGLKWLSKVRLKIPDDDEKDLKDLVKRWRNHARSYNVRALALGQLTIQLGEETEEDYWLPKYFDQYDDSCKKYCMLDTFRTMALFLFYWPIVSGDESLHNTYRKEMNKIWPIVNTMEFHGIGIDPKSLKEETIKCKRDVLVHMNKMQDMIEELNLKPFPPEKYEPKLLKNGTVSKTWKTPVFKADSRQLLRILYLPPEEGGLGLETDRRNRKTGKLTADKDTLRELMHSPFVQELAKYRAAKHTLGLFFNKFAKILMPDPACPGRFMVHPSFNQCGTRTGRFSGGGEGGFNGQQISAGGKKSLSASYSSTKVFVPRPGKLWLGFDFSQQEGRIFAELAQVPVMLNALFSGEDLFKAMSNQIWGGRGNDAAFKAVIQALDLFREPANEHVKEVWKEIDWSRKKAFEIAQFGEGQNAKEVLEIVEWWLDQFDYDIVLAEKSVEKELARQRCKHITYAKIFGGGPGSYTHLIYATLKEAKIFDKEYNTRIPELKRYMGELQKEAEKNGYIHTLYGRKLRVDRDFPYRAVSYKIQGTAADMMKDSLIRVNEFLGPKNNHGAYLILTIHDELKIERDKKNFKPSFAKAIVNIMEDNGGRMKVPMPVEVTVTEKAWGVGEYKLEL